MTGVREPSLTVPIGESRTDRMLRFLGPARAEEAGTAAAYTIGTGQVLRLLTRQLFAYPVVDECADPADALRPVPDIAEELPTRENGGISEHGRTYRIRLRAGVCWDAQAARELTAGDFVRGIKRTAHPGAAAVRPYLAAMVEGMAEYYAAYDEALGDWEPHAPAFAQFQVHTHIAGLRAESDRVLVLRLREPANDLVHLLATGYAAAAPREYDYYVPDSPELHRTSPSAGPYRVARRLSLGGDLVLEHNPRWDPTLDAVRRRTVERIHIEALPGDAEACRGRLAAGDLDPAWSFGVVSWSVPPIDPPAAHPGLGLSPYLLFGPGVGRDVRRAVAFGADRAAVAAAVGAAGGLGAAPQSGVIPAGSPGHADGDVSATGDPVRARRLLAGAGLPGGVRLTVGLPPGDRYRNAARVLGDSLARCGITMVAVPLPADGGDAPVDVLLAEWTPGWAGNNGRDLLHRLWRPECLPQTVAAEPAADVARLAALALQHADPTGADDLWRQVNLAIMDDARVVPLAAAAWPDAMAAAATGGAARWTGPAA